MPNLFRSVRPGTNRLCDICTRQIAYVRRCYCHQLIASGHARRILWLAATFSAAKLLYLAHITRSLATLTNLDALQDGWFWLLNHDVFSSKVAITTHSLLVGLNLELDSRWHSA